MMVVDRLGKGGVHHYALGLAGALAEAGAQVTLLTTTPREEVPAPDGIDLRRRLSWADKDSRVTALVRELVNLAITVWVSLASQSRVVIVQLAHPAMTDRWAVPLLQVLGRRVVLTCHNLGWHERDGRIEAHGLATYRKADAVVTLSDAERDRLVDADAAMAARSLTIPHGDLGFLTGTKLPMAQARRRLDLASDGRLLLFFGYFKEYKGADVLLDAVAVLRDRERSVPVVLAGQAEAGPAAALEEQVRRLGIGDLVTIHGGYVAVEDAAAYFAAADAVVLPYRHATQSGVVQLAYAYGRPVVVTDVGGLVEDVVAGKTGEIARPGDPADLADAIERLVDDPEHLAAVQAELEASPPERNRWGNVAGAYLRLAEDIGASTGGDAGPVVVWATDVQWDGLRYGVHHLAARLSECGYRVLFCEVPVSILSPLRDRGRLRQLRRRFRRVSATLAVDVPVGIPPQDHPRLRELNAGVHARRIRRVLRRSGWDDPALIVGRYPYSWRLARHFPGAAFVANLSDTTWSQDPADVAEMQARLDTADGAVCVSPPLVEMAEAAGVQHTLLLHQGVDAEAVRVAADTGPDTTVIALGHPVVGCLGNITPRTDFALIERLAAVRPDWEFVLVGAATPLFRELDVTRMDSLPNVHRLPPCRPEDVGSIVAAFDVAWVPYVWSEFNVASNPLKAWEYLAVGVPVVAPAFPALGAMDVVATLLGPDATDADWLAAIEAALEDDSVEQREARRAFAAANTWDARVADLVDFLSMLVPSATGTEPLRRRAHPR